MKLNALSVSALVLAVAALGVSAAVALKPSPAPLGAQPGPDVDSPSQAINNVQRHFFSSGLNQASTTICSFKTPAATTTLVFASAQLRTGTTTTIQLEIGRATSLNATTTSLGTATIASAAQDTVVASTTPTGAEATVFPPSNYLNVKFGGTLGDTNVLVGSCKAEFIEN